MWFTYLCNLCIEEFSLKQFSWMSGWESGRRVQRWGVTRLRTMRAQGSGRRTSASRASTCSGSSGRGPLPGSVCVRWDDDSLVLTIIACILFQDKGTSNYYALKILTMSQVIKLKQVEHVINERDILRQALEQRTITLSDFIGNLFQRGEPPLHSLPALELQGLSLPLHALSLHLWWRTFQSPQEHTTVILWFAVKCFFVDSITPFVCHGNFLGLQDLT